MTAQLFKGLPKAYLLAALAIAFTATSLPAAAARVLHSADQVQSGVTVPNIPKETYEELIGRITKLESSVGIIPKWPKGCNNDTDMSQECQQAKEAIEQSDMVLAILGFFCAGVLFVLICTLCFCPNCLDQLEAAALQAPSSPVAPAQEMVPLSKVEGTRERIGKVIKQGDPGEIALALLGNVSRQRASPWSEDYMHWADPTKHGAASAGPSVMIVYYSPVLTHEAADKLCHVICEIRTQAQNCPGASNPLKQENKLYGALIGLLLSTDVADNQQLVEKCRRHGLSVWLPGGSWLEGSKQAAIAWAPEMSSNGNPL